MPIIQRYAPTAGLILLLAGAWQCKGPANPSTNPDAAPDAGSGTRASAAIYRNGATYQNKTGRWEKFRLPDSTEVLLNDKGLLSISGGFNKSDRELQLDGEAVFDVNADAGKPFVVRTRNLQILVLGTRFRVDAHADSPGEEVDLLTGRLKVIKSYHSTTDNEPEVLQAGEMVMINRDIDLMEKETMDSTELRKVQALR